MKTPIRAGIAAAAAAALVFAAAPAQAKPISEPAGSIVDIAVAASGGGALDSNPADYDILVQAVLATGLAPTLAGAGDFTVFAPTDQAFLNLVADLGAPGLSEAEALGVITSTFSIPQITEILLYHVAGESLSTVEVKKSGGLTMLDGGMISPRGVNLRDETPGLTDPKIVNEFSNIGATNGVIHTIDRVLVPAL